MAARINLVDPADGVRAQGTLLAEGGGRTSRGLATSGLADERTRRRVTERSELRLGRLAVAARAATEAAVPERQPRAAYRRRSGLLLRRAAVYLESARCPGGEHRDWSRSGVGRREEVRRRFRDARPA